jgi:antitoxin component YwqK of YwqJK toxin-antitoxin module
MVLTRFAGTCAITVASFAAGACGSGGTEAAAKKDVASEYDKSGRLTRLTYDRNGDGKIDTWGYMDGSRVVRVEVDENGDGQVDRWEYHAAAAAQGARGAQGAQGAQGTQSATAVDGVDLTLERIDRATKFDGKVSRHDYFENGVLLRVEEDTDGDGKIDKWETYSGGTLAIMAIDTKGRGTPDRRLIYQSDGTLSRIETDPNATGTFRPLPQ